MANKVESEPQVSKHLAQTTTITFSSKAAVKVGNDFYSFEYSETRQVPFGANVDVEVKALTSDVNNVIDDQIDQIVAATQGAK